MTWLSEMLIAKWLGAARLAWLYLRLLFVFRVYVPLGFITWFQPWHGRGKNTWLLSVATLPYPEILMAHSLKHVESLVGERYGVFGQWGHGVNSYALYIGFRRENVLVHLRLSLGGVYSEMGEQRRNIRRKLAAVSKLVRVAQATGTSLELLINMGSGEVCWQRADGSDGRIKGYWARDSKALDQLARTLASGQNPGSSIDD